MRSAKHFKLGAALSVNTRLQYPGLFRIYIGGTGVFAEDEISQIELIPENASRMIAALVRMGYKPLLPIPAKDFIDETKRKSWIEQRNLKVFTFWDPTNELPNIDIFVETPINFSKLDAQSESIDLGEVNCCIASIPHLIQMKTGTGRSKDQEDIKNLKDLLEGSNGE